MNCSSPVCVCVLLNGVAGVSVDTAEYGDLVVMTSVIAGLLSCFANARVTLLERAFLSISILASRRAFSADS